MKNKPSDPNNETNSDFWDLGDDDLELGSPATEKPADPAPRPVTSTLDEPVRVLQTPTTPAEDSDSGQAASASQPTRVRVNSFKKNDPEPTSMTEKILLATLILCLTGFAVWGVSTFYTSADNAEFLEYTDDFPIEKGEISIESIETWWREPIREGDNPDVGIVAEARLIPCAKIKLLKSNSTTLQVSFRDGEDNLIGDTLNLAVENGKFISSSSDEIDVHATAGFKTPALFHPYANGDISPWSLAIVEGDQSDSPLARTRIEANHKESK